MAKESRKPRVLIVDDESTMQEGLELMLGDRFEFEACRSAEEGVVRAERHGFDVVLMDIRFPDGIDGLHALEILGRNGDGPAVIMLTEDKTMDSVVRAIRAGAFHYIQKPPNARELEHLLGKAIAERQMVDEIRRLKEENSGLRGALVAEDPATLAVLRELESVADTDVTVLLTGETGTGKEEFARRLHGLSFRSEAPFEPVNTVALPSQLIESELFGHEKGAFSDAVERKIGAFERANSGTIFLDEIGDAPPAVQARLLRTLNDRIIRRVGGDNHIAVDVRFVAATHHDLESDVEAGLFREDLYYRLNVVRIRIPALRDRRADIIPLARYFLARESRICRRHIERFTAEAEAWLLQQPWKGNVRELLNVVRAAVAKTHFTTIDLGALVGVHGAGTESLDGLLYEDAKSRAIFQLKSRYIPERLRLCDGSVTEAAKASGLSRKGFREMMREIGLP